MTRKSLVAVVAAVIILCAGAAAVVVPVLTSTTSAQASNHTALDFWMGCESIEWSSASCMIACSNMRSTEACYDGPNPNCSDPTDPSCRWGTRWPTLEETEEYFGED